MFVHQSEVGWQIFQSSIFLFIFLSSLAHWSDSCYGMWCGTKGVEIQKLSDLLERSLSPSSVTLFVSQSVYSVHSLFSLPAFLALDLSITYLFTLSGCCTLMWRWHRYSLLGLFLHSFCFLTHIQHGYILQQHTLVHAQNHTNLKHKLLQAGMCGNLPLATSVTCIWSWWGAKKATDPGD